ncbi:hypothetical protein Leryth_027393, partial [Lithospermum erythrorhizon]
LVNFLDLHPFTSSLFPQSFRSCSSYSLFFVSFSVALVDDIYFCFYIYINFVLYFIIIIIIIKITYLIRFKCIFLPIFSQFAPLYIIFYSPIFHSCSSYSLFLFLFPSTFDDFYLVFILYINFVLYLLLLLLGKITNLIRFKFIFLLIF